MPLANFEVVKELTTEDFIVIRDLGPWDHYQTITNAAEEVVDTLYKDGLLDGRRLFYFDSQGDLDQLAYENGRFAGFIRISQSWRDEVKRLESSIQ